MFTRLFAVAFGAMIAVAPVKAFAADITVDDIETAVEIVEDAITYTEETAEEEVTEETTEDAEEVAEETEEVVEVAAVEETAEVAEEVVAEEVAEEETVVDEVAEAVEETVTPAYDKKAVQYLKTAAKNQALLSTNSWSGGYAATNQVNRCREMAKNLLAFYSKYMQGEHLLGIAYDMNLGDNNYISLEIKDLETGEIYTMYYDFYMQDANGNNITNALQYHKVDRIVIVEKGEYTGDWKMGMFSHPTFASKSNGVVVMDINTYSELLSDEFISYVESIANAQ